jgi:hypothetical protein
MKRRIRVPPPAWFSWSPRHVPVVVDRECRRRPARLGCDRTSRMIRA